MTQPTCVFCDQPLTGRDLDAALRPSMPLTRRRWGIRRHQTQKSRPQDKPEGGEHAD